MPIDFNYGYNFEKIDVNWSLYQSFIVLTLESLFKIFNFISDFRYLDFKETMLLYIRHSLIVT